MKEIILIGGGGHCRAVIDVIEQQAEYKISGIVDKPELLGSNVLGYPIIGNDSDLINLAKKYQYALVTAGQIKSPTVRIKLFNLAIDAGFKLPTVISPRAYLSKYATVGRGSIVIHDVLINAKAIIGDNCIINSKALIEHDVVVENHCHISTGSIINGGTVVELGCFIGSGVITKESIIIKQNSFIKAGTIVT
jgi:sugar O-acyltransferase (sialic acid O-acetyltransferase NeuD family)